MNEGYGLKMWTLIKYDENFIFPTKGNTFFDYTWQQSLKRVNLGWMDQSAANWESGILSGHVTNPQLDQWPNENCQILLWQPNSVKKLNKFWTKKCLSVSMNFK